jgi:hypothetical protein
MGHPTSRKRPTFGKDQLSEKTNPLEKTKKEKQKRRSALQPSGAF